MNMRKLLAVILAASVGLAAFAADVVGTWKGQVVYQVPDSMKAQMKGQPTPTVEITIKADKTYSGKQSGTTDKQVHTVEGTWTFAGDKVTLQPKKRDGKAAEGEGAKPRIYVLAKDGKSLSMDLSGEVQMMNSKGEKGKTTGAAPKITVKIVLRKV